MKFAISFAIVPILFAMTGCTTFKPGCLMKDMVLSSAVDTIAHKLQCANSVAITKDLESGFNDLGLCKTPTGPIGDVMCPIAVKQVVDYVAENAIPEEWQCTAADAKTGLTSALTAACRRIPVKNPQ